MITINLDTNKDSHLQKFIRLAELLKIPFQITKPNDLLSEDWGDWEDVDDIAFSQFAMSQVADDWDCPEDVHWNGFYEQTKPIIT